LISLEGRFFRNPIKKWYLEIMNERKMEEAPGGAHALSMSRISPGIKKRMARLLEASHGYTEDGKSIDSKKTPKP
jgi:hypothetical protein